MTPAADELGLRLVEIVRASPWFMGALRRVRELGLAHWCIGAGAVRNLVWNQLHGKREPSPLADMDVASSSHRIFRRSAMRNCNPRCRPPTPARLGR